MHFSRIFVILATSVLVSTAPMGDGEMMTTADNQMKHGHSADRMMPSTMERHLPRMEDMTFTDGSASHSSREGNTMDAEGSAMHVPRGDTMMKTDGTARHMSRGDMDSDGMMRPSKADGTMGRDATMDCLRDGCRGMAATDNHARAEFTQDMKEGTENMGGSDHTNGF